MVVSELRGEKIDIIPWNTEPARFIAKALSPARVREVLVDDDTREATVIVPDDQLALAIGKEGLNARLAARLTGWKIDIQSDTEFAQAEAEAAYGGGERGEEEFTGRCAAVLSNGKRCPNASLPGTRFCGVPAHQELASKAPEELVGQVVADRRPVRSTATSDRGAEVDDADGGGARRASRSAAAAEAPPDETEERRSASDARSRTCAGCGRKAPQPELLRFVAPTACSCPAPRGPGAAPTRAGGSPASSGRASRHAFNRTLRRTVRVDPELARLYTGAHDG